MTNSTNNLTIPDFATEFQKNWGTLTKDDKGNCGKNPKEAAKRAVQIYLNTINSSKPYVLIGPDQIRNNPKYSREGLITSDPKTGCDGAIFGEQPWSMLMNDVFILGSINTSKEVVLTYPKTKQNLLSNCFENKKKKPLGVELSSLCVANYQLSQDKKGECKFNSSEKPDIPTISELRSRVSDINKDDVARLLHLNLSQ